MQIFSYGGAYPHPKVFIVLLKESDIQNIHPSSIIPNQVQLEGTENYNDETLGEAEEVSAYTYYPVDSSVLNNIVGSVQVRMVLKRALLVIFP